MECWKCGDKLHLPSTARMLPFRATCDKCSAWLHCCKNCNNYKPGLPNDCKVPGTEPISDREACNFCEEFDLLGRATIKGTSVEEASRRLFGEDRDVPRTGNFDDLFKH